MPGIHVFLSLKDVTNSDVLDIDCVEIQIEI